MTSNAVLARIAIDTIVFATDFSPSSNSALPCAIAMAKRCQARLILAHVVTAPTLIEPEPGMSPRDTERLNHLQTEAGHSLARLCASDTFEGVEYETMIRSGEVWNGISRIIMERDVKLVVLGTRALSGVRKLRQGSTAEDVMRAIRCPVMIVGPNAASCPACRFTRILYATNFAKASLYALRYSLALAHEDLASLTALHVLPIASASKGSDKLRQQYKQKLLDMVSAECDSGLKLNAVVEFGRPGEEIVRRAEAEQSDLIVLGAHAAGRAATFLPSTVHYILSHARCPVLATCAE